MYENLEACVVARAKRTRWYCDTESGVTETSFLASDVEAGEVDG